jgi:hypothetical protein
MLKTAADTAEPATSLTHPLHRYPASMSPFLARALILGLSKPGDVILDPFCGGGTTAIESLVNNRNVICSDLNSLACFITRAKAQPMGYSSLNTYRKWVVDTLHFLTAPEFQSMPVVTKSGLRHSPRTNGLLMLLRNSALELQLNKARDLALLTILRVGQLCFDCRPTPPTPRRLADIFAKVAAATTWVVLAFFSSPALTAFNLLSPGAVPMHQEPHPETTYGGSL